MSLVFKNSSFYDLMAANNLGSICFLDVFHMLTCKFKRVKIM